MNKKQSFIMALCLLLGTQFAWADRQESDTLEVLFRVGQSDIDLSYADNARRIDGFVDRVRTRYYNVPASQLKLDVEAGASPEGLPGLNKQLGEKRGIALRNILVEKLGTRFANITVYNRGPRWGGLRQLVAESNEPWKEDVLRIISSQPGENDFEIDPRERELRRLQGGRVWVQLQNKYLTKLRSSGMAILAEIPEPVHRVDTIVILDTIIYEPEPCPIYVPPVFYSKNPAIKTNAILWGLGAPNVQLEIPLGKRNRWSLEGEVFWPWFTWDESSHAEQAGNIGIEARYWLGNRMKHHTLDGWHIGLAFAVGYYDIEWKQHEGYQGEYTNTYFNIGWQKRFGKYRRWGFDASIGLGWFHTQYRHYLGSSIYPVGHEEEKDYHLMWQDDLNKHKPYNQYLNIFGLTHANLSVSYFLGKQKYRTRYITPAEIEAEYQRDLDAKAAKAKAKEEAKALKASQKQAEADAKAAAKAAEADAKAQAKAQEQAAKEAQKTAEANAKAQAQAAKEAEKAAEAEAKAKAKAQEQAAKEAQKAAIAETKAHALAAKAAESEARAQAKAQAEAAKEAEKAAEAEAKAQAKAQAQAAKDAEKAAAAQAKAQEQAAKEAEKAAEAEAKAQAKAAKEAEKAAEAQAKEQAKAQAQAAKEAEKAAAAQAKAQEQAAKEAEKAAAAQAKAQEQAAKEAQKAAEAQAKAQAKAQEQAAKEAEKAAAAQAKAQEQAAKEAQKAAAAQAKAQEQAAKEAQKAAKAQAKAAAKEAEAQAKAQAKAAEAEAKAAAKAAKEAAKAEKSNAK